MSRFTLTHRQKLIIRNEFEEQKAQGHELEGEDSYSEPENEPDEGSALQFSVLSS